MELVYNIFSKTYEPLTKAFPTSNKYEIPAWSLHRLIELLPQDIHLDDYADMSSANCIQQCVNNIQTNIQEVDNIITQKINANIK